MEAPLHVLQKKDVVISEPESKHDDLRNDISGALAPENDVTILERAKSYSLDYLFFRPLKLPMEERPKKRFRESAKSADRFFSHCLHRYSEADSGLRIERRKKF